MLLRIVLIILAASFLPSCSHKTVNSANHNRNNPSTKSQANSQPQPQAQTHPTVQTRNLGHFSRISIQGAMNVRLHTGFHTPKIILHGNSLDLTRTITNVNGDTLFIRQIGAPSAAVTVDIHAQVLHGFSYKGAGVIKGENIHSSLLDLELENPEKTLLAGQINLHKLVVKGSGFVEINGVKSPYLLVKTKGNPHIQLTGIAKLARLNLDGGWFGLYWVSNDVLTIRAKNNAFVQLAGIANRLDLELWGTARFNGRFLRASRTFVKTHQTSVAEINSVDRQHTLATDYSDIRFYNVPVLKTDFMACNGAVLDMRDWNYPFMQEYNRYNKDMPIGDW